MTHSLCCRFVVWFGSVVRRGVHQAVPRQLPRGRHTLVLFDWYGILAILIIISNLATALFLVGSLAASVVVIAVMKFYISKKWGFVLLGVYIVYSVFLILGELHILF